MSANKIFALIELFLALLVASHALLYKRDTRSSTFWILLILLLSWVGMIFYALFGINRIRVLATHYTTGADSFRTILRPPNIKEPLALEKINGTFQAADSIDILENGDQCYPAMLQHIENAFHEILLSSYIFDNDSIGKQFVSALQKAQNRGVNVYVLIDGVGKLYSIPTITSLLKNANLNFAVFLPTLAPWSLRFLNLRNHRKLLIIDRQAAFLGGMNIRRSHVLAEKTKSPVRDVHFLLKGTELDKFIDTFASDWRFATNGGELRPIAEKIERIPQINMRHIRCRILPDGPNLNHPKLALTLLVKISEAQKQLRIVTPYFLPDRIFIMALATAALRGVNVTILLPQKNNLPWVKWAMAGQAWQLLEYGIKIYESPGEFDHSKIFTADSNYAIVGSSNWDARSLRLNFEINMEVYNDEFAQRLNHLIDHRLEKSREINLAAVNSRRLLTRLRDNSARLFLPIL
ncbi:MAG: PLDc N-terminal domain-containing protein [Oligoflexales bacterium]|nr:PLDc N-terminal domain-containing protein [Oligoflexales bacterium]